MKTIEIARRMAELGQAKDAIDAYTLTAYESEEPEELLEAAVFLLQNGGSYRVAYTVLVHLFNAGCYPEEIMPLLIKIFYEPNVRRNKNRYDRNCRLLEKYPYFFRGDRAFPAFDELPISFFPFDEHHGYLPFSMAERRFGEYLNTREPVVRHYFFRDLDKPILTEDIFSQYELEYLNDNVRPGEYIGRENHIYLHYTDWGTFCAWLQVLNLKPLLEQKKFVILIGDEIAQYPIDFKERYGIDYSQYPVRPLGIREINKMIWHTQLSTHNGGDFFNEIFDAHPNLLCMPSMMFNNVEENLENLRKALGRAQSIQQLAAMIPHWDPALVRELFLMRNVTDKDLLVALYLGEKSWTKFVDKSSRIVPAVFFQPHFSNIVYSLEVNADGNTVLDAANVDEIHHSPIFRDFKYIKTFTPMRRFTTSHGGTVKFMYRKANEQLENEPDAQKKGVVPDAVMQRILNRSFMRDPEDRLYKDSIIVRFEDGKLNPKATFTALAAFLDLPYTETMTYCSERGERDHLGYEGNVVGFDPETVYRTYDEYVNDSERYFIEYFLRDAYEYYGYSFHYYDGADVDAAKIAELTEHFDTIDSYIRKTWRKIFAEAEVSMNGVRVASEVEEKMQERLLENHIQKYHQNRIDSAEIMMRGLRFINKRGQPLHMTPVVQLDPALLENEIYH